MFSTGEGDREQDTARASWDSVVIEYAKREFIRLNTALVCESGVIAVNGKEISGSLLSLGKQIVIVVGGGVDYQVVRRLEGRISFEGISMRERGRKDGQRFPSSLHGKE